MRVRFLVENRSGMIFSAPSMDNIVQVWEPLTSQETELAVENATSTRGALKPFIEA